MPSSMDSPIAQSDSFVDFLPAPPPEPAPENLRNLLPDYRIDYLLGVGGFADVYKGVDKEEKEVALKIPKMDANLANKDPKVIERFRSEAELWLRLEHKNIVNLFGIRTEPVPHMAMELLVGGSLKQLMKKHDLTVGEAVLIMVQILEGLSYAHKMASVHRDIKPENILFTTRGVAKITDWGIGKFMASESKTGSRDFKGTLSYCAPEQFNKREYGNVDWQTDIFQVGVMFYKMVTGINPFKGEDIADCMGKVLMERPDPPSAHNPEVPPELDEVIMGALKKRKEDRWGTDVMLYKLKEISEKKIIRPQDLPSDAEGEGDTGAARVTDSITQDSVQPASPQEPEIPQSTQSIILESVRSPPPREPKASRDVGSTAEETVPSIPPREAGAAQAPESIVETSTTSAPPQEPEATKVTESTEQSPVPSAPPRETPTEGGTADPPLPSDIQPQRIYTLALITFVLLIFGVFAVAFFLVIKSIPPPVRFVGIVFFGLVFGVGGILFSTISMRKIDNNPQLYKGRTMAIIGIIVGIILVFGGILGIIYIRLISKRF